MGRRRLLLDDHALRRVPQAGTWGAPHPGPRGVGQDITERKVAWMVYMIGTGGGRRWRSRSGWRVVGLGRADATSSSVAAVQVREQQHSRGIATEGCPLLYNAILTCPAGRPRHYVTHP